MRILTALPCLLIGHDFLHSCLHRFGLHRSEETTAIRVISSFCLRLATPDFLFGISGKGFLCSLISVQGKNDLKVFNFENNEHNFQGGLKMASYIVASSVRILIGFSIIKDIWYYLLSKSYLYLPSEFEDMPQPIESINIMGIPCSNSDGRHNL